MLVVTERAKKRLKHLLLSKVDDPQAGLRFNVTDEQALSISIDIEEPGDYVIQYDGLKVMMMKEEMASRLNGFTFDLADETEESEFTFYKN